MIDPYSHRNVWRIAAPLILSNVSVPLLGLVDTAVMGHLDQAEYLGAVAIGATIFSFLFMGLNFLRMGTTGLTAQALGRGDSDELRTALGRALLTACFLGGLLILIQVPLGNIGLQLLGSDEAVWRPARAYYDIRIWAAPAVLSNFVVVGWFIGVHSGRGPLVMLLTANLVNIVLDLLFVVGLGQRTEGVALASVIAEHVGLVVGLLLVRWKLRDYPGNWRLGAILNVDGFRRLISINVNLFVRTMALLFAFGFLTAQGARLGTTVLAANAVLLNFQYFMAYALDGLANAAEALVGKAIGERSRVGLNRSVVISIQWSALVAAVFSVAYALGGPAVVALITSLEEVRNCASAFLIWIVLSPLVSVWSFAFDGIFVGATRAREMRNAMLLSTLGVFLPAWYLLRPLGNHGLWLSFLLFMGARAITLFWRFRADHEKWIAS